MFLTTLAISNGRLDRLLKKQQTTSDIVPHDLRGRAASVNKTPDYKILKVAAHIKKFSITTSHYAREKNIERLYLPPDLNLRKVYDIYLEENPDQESYVSEKIYRKVFKEKFPNLRFQDTCKTCDMLNAKISAATPSGKSSLKKDLELHQRQAEAARSSFKRAK